jgi:hypothetical protein
MTNDHAPMTNQTANDNANVRPGRRQAAVLVPLVIASCRFIGHWCLVLGHWQLAVGDE